MKNRRKMQVRLSLPDVGFLSLMDMGVDMQRNLEVVGGA